MPNHQHHDNRALGRIASGRPVYAPQTVTDAQHPRREFVLARLREADGPAYDQLVREVAEAFPDRNRYQASIRAVRAVRRLLFEGFAATESDESVWLTPDGWRRAGDLAEAAGSTR